MLSPFKRAARSDTVKEFACSCSLLMCFKLQFDTYVLVHAVATELASSLAFAGARVEFWFCTCKVLQYCSSVDVVQ